MKYAKEHLKIPEVYAITIAENEKSIKLLERIGMKFIKTIFLSNDKEELLLFSSGVAVKDDLVSIKGLNIEQELTVRRLDREEEIPYSLLLIADDAVEAIDKYLPHSEVYVCEKREQMIAVYVLHTIDSTSAEIKNIAVSPEYQGYGIGTYLINNIIQDLSKKGFKSLLVGTGVTSERPIKLYRRLGFKDFKIIKDFFIDNYPQPIYEGGKRLRDMIVLKLDL